MRILAVTNLYPSPFEPTRAAFNRVQLQALAASHQVQVIAPIPWAYELGQRLRGAAKLPPGRRMACHGVVVDYPRYFYPPRLLGWHGYWYLRCIRSTFRRALEELRPDVVFASWAFPDGWAALRLARQAGLPVVIKVHGSDVLWELGRHAGKARRTAEALGEADAVVAVSGDLARNVIQLGADPDRVRVVYNGVDAQVFHPEGRAEARAWLGLGGPDPVLLCVARLVPVKGLEVLVDACGKLWQSGARFRCFVIGEGPLRARLVDQARAAGLEGAVTFLDCMPHNALADWYRAADLFVLPSFSEGVPGVLLEAMACGAPFVATRVGGIPEVAHLGKGRLVPPRDTAALAEAIAEVLSNRAQAGRRAASLRGHADAAAELAEVFEGVIGRSQRLTAGAV